MGGDASRLGNLRGWVGASPAGCGTACTLASPFSLGTGVGKLSAGAALLLRAGTYVQSVWVGAGGTQAKPIVVAGYPGETAVIDEEDATAELTP